MGRNNKRKAETTVSSQNTSKKKQANNNGKKNTRYNQLPDGATVDANGVTTYPSLPPSTRPSRSSSQMSTTSVRHQSQLNQQMVTSSTIKPVFVDTPFEVIRNKLPAFGLKEPPAIKIMNQNKKVQITCKSSADKVKLIEKLIESHLEYFTFTEPNAKPMIYVLKGLYNMTKDEALALLKDEKIPATNVTLLNPKNTDTPSLFTSNEESSPLEHCNKPTE